MVYNIFLTNIALRSLNFFFLLISINLLSTIIFDNSLYCQNNQIEYNIEKFAEDSIKIKSDSNKIYLFGNARINYEGMIVEADIIVLDSENSIIKAFSKKDSLRNIITYAKFTDKQQSFEAEEIRYNFKTKKSFAKGIITNEGEGYLQGKQVKNTDNKITYIQRGLYTTCNARKPHYHIYSKKIKVIKDNKIITGPAILKFWKIPTPIVLPFGYFPNSKNESSGLLLPSYGESASLGFFLKDLGYYFSLNEYSDLNVTSDIYSKGSFGLKSNYRYKKRYFYSGNLNLSFGNIINSEKGFNDYSVKRDFFIRWQHNQDAKLNPNLQFSANVNGGSSTFHRNNSFNSNDYLSNTFQSNITLNRKWDNKPYNMNINFRHSQNTRTKNISLTVPEIGFNVNRVFPFAENSKLDFLKRLNLSYSTNFKNQISVADSLLFNKSTFRKFRSGIRHNIPISTSVKFFKYFNFSPKINYNERWYFSQIEKNWNIENQEIDTDTLFRFTRASEINLNAGLNTKIYGTANFSKGYIRGIRHVITPNVSFNYRPNISKNLFREVQSSSTGNKSEYSIVQNGIYGSPANRQSGTINLNINNLMELKVKNKKDTINNIKKIKLVESLNINTNYNIFSDSLKIGDINLSMRTRLFDLLDINMASRYDPYIVNSNRNGNLNKLEIRENKRLARFVSANANIGLNISNNTFKISNENFTWNFSTNYSLSYFKGYKSSAEADTIQTLNFSANFNLLKKWKIGINSGYDFDRNDLSYTSINLYRDLHCWELLFNLIPLGYHRSYYITLRVKADILKDLKLERRRDWISPNF